MIISIMLEIECTDELCVEHWSYQIHYFTIHFQFYLTNLTNIWKNNSTSKKKNYTHSKLELQGKVNKVFCGRVGELVVCFFIVAVRLKVLMLLGREFKNWAVLGRVWIGDSSWHGENDVGIWCCQFWVIWIVGTLSITELTFYDFSISLSSSENWYFIYWSKSSIFFCSAPAHPFVSKFVYCFIMVK